MAVHIENVSSTVSVTDGGAGLQGSQLRQVVAAVIAELGSMQAREQRAARDRRLGEDDHGSCGCGGRR